MIAINDEIFEAGMHVSLEIKTIIAYLKTLCTEDFYTIHMNISSLNLAYEYYSLEWLLFRYEVNYS